MTRDIFLRLATMATVAVCLHGAVRADSVTRFEYDNAGQVTRQYIQDSATSQVLSDARMSYDNLGRIWRVRQLATPGGAPNDSADRIVETGFDQAGNTTSVRQRAISGDAVMVYAYDSANRRTSVTDPELGLATYDHDKRGNVTYVLDPVGNESRFTFDAGGWQTVVERYSLTTLALRIVSEFDSRGQKIREIAYDAAAAPLTQKRWVFDSLGRNTQRVQMADPASTASVDLATDGIAVFTYDSASTRLLSQVTYAGDPPAPRTMTYQYDDIGRLTLTTDPNNNTESATYNVHSQVNTKTITEPPLASRSFSFAYDNHGRMTSETAAGPPALTTSQEYDVLDRRTRMTDAENICTSYQYNGFGDQTRMIEDCNGATPRETENQYNQLGYLSLHRTWDGQGLTETTTYQTDLMGRRKRIDFCDGGAWVYQYDDAGRMTHRTDPRNQVSLYTRNWRGQVLTKTVNGQPQETFEFTPLGWMTLAERDADNKVIYLHDAFGQVTSETQSISGTSKTVTYDYNQAGNRSGIGYPADTGADLTFSHDSAGQTTEIQRNGSNLATYTYAGRYPTDRDIRTASVLPTWVRLDISYDVHRRRSPIVNTVETTGGSTELDRYIYTYDNVGNRDTATITGDASIADSVNYGYDDFHRLTTATYASDASNESIGYDLLGNRLTYDDRSASTTSYTHNCVNEYTNITPGGNNPEYDLAGNLTRTETDYELAYDYENRLVEVKDPLNSVIAEYTYDALGRRASQSKDGTTTRFYYDDDNVIAEYGASDTLQRYYVHGPTYVDEHLLLHDVQQGEFYYLLTALYSVSGLVNADGLVVQRHTYDAYGLPQSASEGGGGACDLSGDLEGDGDVDSDDFIVFTATFALCSGAGGYNPAADFDADNCITFADYQQWYQLYRGCIPDSSSNPYFFTGRRLDFDIRSAGYAPELALYHYRARAYDPWHGRFLQHDPALYRESLNLYQYVLSNPQLLTDPTGQWSYTEILITTGTMAWMAYNIADTALGIRDFVQSFVDLLSARNRTLDMYLAVGIEGVFLFGDSLLGPIDEVVGLARGMRAVRGVKKAGKRFGDMSAKELTKVIKEIGDGNTIQGLPNFLKALDKADFDEIWANPKLKDSISGHVRDFLGGKRVKGGYHEWIQVHFLPEIMDRPDKGAWIDAMLKYKKKITGEFADIHVDPDFHPALDAVWEPGMSLDEYLQAIANVADDWGIPIP